MVLMKNRININNILIIFPIFLAPISADDKLGTLKMIYAKQLLLDIGRGKKKKIENCIPCTSNG